MESSIETTDGDSEMPSLDLVRWLHVALIPCCGIGMLLIWLSPRWSQQAKWLWTAGFVVMFLIGRSATNRERGKVASQVSEAHQLWDQGNEAEAAQIYRELTDAKSTFVADDEKPKVFERSIRFFVERGNTGDATEILEHANRFNVPIVSESSAVNRLIQEFERQQEAEKFANSQQRAEEIALPTGRTSPTGVDVGPAYSEEKLQLIATKILENSHRFQAGTPIQSVLAELGQPTRFSRTDAFGNSSPEEREKLLSNPSIPSTVKTQMQKVIEVCVWSYESEPDSYFIMMGFSNGVLADDWKESMKVKLP